MNTTFYQIKQMSDKSVKLSDLTDPLVNKIANYSISVIGFYSFTDSKGMRIFVTK